MQVIDFRARPNTAEYLRMWQGLQQQRFLEKLGRTLPGPASLEAFVDELDRNQIQRAVFTGRQQVRNGTVSFGVANDYVLECQKDYPDRIVGFAGIDISQAAADAVAEVRRAAGLGFKGVSLDITGDTILGDVAYAVYDACVKLRLLVIVTMGAFVRPIVDPWQLDRIATDFPSLRVIGSHACYPQVTELVAVAYRNEHVFLECSLYVYLPGAEPFIDAARSLIRDKVLYASSYPLHPLDTVERFRALGLPDDALELILYRNAAGLLA